MNKAELQLILAQEGFRKDGYELEGGHPSECYVLAHEGNCWSVYYSERGLESGKRCFAFEDEACQYMLKLMRKDPTTKQK